ncbi:MAG: M42 family metallopeptidase [bacterium]|nr:M42 family metallopeptidase [bacterium]
MQKDQKDFLFSLLDTPSPSGFESAIQRVVRKRAEKYADTVEIDVHGNLTACVNPKGKVRVMLAGHCDQIGLMVTHIDDKGFLYVDQIGGIDAAVLPGTRLMIHGREKSIPGIIGHKPVHLVPANDRGKKIELSAVWVDIGAATAEEAKKVVAVGDPVTFAPYRELLGENILSSQGCDDRVGVYVVMEAMRIFAAEIKKKGSHPVALYAVSTVQEEIGLRGARTSAYGIDPQVGIAVDVTHASDNPGASAKEIGTVLLGQGPTIARGPNINPVLEGLLVETAKKKKLPWQSISAPRATGTDANAIQINRAGVAAALIGLPNRYMHSQVECVDLRDLQNAAQLIAATVLGISNKTSFIPV